MARTTAKSMSSAELLISREELIMTADNIKGEERGASLEKYLLMGEKEKDIEIQKAVARLQKRIQEILYLLEMDKPRVAGAETLKKNE
jgi:hypothetical protein